MPLRETFVISSEPQHYFVNGVKYVVHSRFQDMGESNVTLKLRFGRILENISPAHLTDDDSIKEKKLIEAELQKSIVRNERVATLYEKLYEDNAEGKVTDEWFMQLSHKYEVERMELKAKIADYKEQLRKLAESNRNKESFIAAIRKFMEMKEITPALLKELIEKIEVHETEGVGKNRTQRIVIHYRFVGCIEILACPKKSRYTAETRKGVAVNYLTA